MKSTVFVALMSLFLATDAFTPLNHPKRQTDLFQSTVIESPPRTEAYTRTEYVPSASVPAQKVAMGNANVYANKIEEMRARTQQTTAMSAQRVAELERNRKNRILYQVAPTTPVSSTFAASGI